MTGVLVFAAAVLLLIAALSPAHRRAAGSPWRPGADRANDRDEQRVATELAAVAQREARGPRRFGALLGAAGSASPFHRVTLARRTATAPRLRSH